MGAVWSAEHLALGTPVAVKLLDPSLVASSAANARFRKEARTAASLSGTHLVHILDYGVDDGCPYFVMERLQGEPLSRYRARERRLSPRRTAELLSQAGKALAWAHECGVVHRDIKPDNIFLAQVGGVEVVKVLDFGIAKTTTLDTLQPDTQTGAMMGTPFYMSPEQAMGSDVDSRADIWAFGVTVYECLIGALPFHTDRLGGLVLAICSKPIPVPSQQGQVPAGFDEWFAHCVHRDRDQRFATIGIAIAELRRVCGVADPPWDASVGRFGVRSGEVVAHPVSSLTLAVPNTLSAPGALAATADQSAADGPTSRAWTLAENRAQMPVHGAPFNPAMGPARRRRTLDMRLVFIGVLAIGIAWSSMDEPRSATAHKFGATWRERRAEVRASARPSGPAGPATSSVPVQSSPVPTPASPAASRQEPHRPSKSRPTASTAIGVPSSYTSSPTPVAPSATSSRQVYVDRVGL